MPLSFLSLGDLSNAESAAGKKFIEMPGDRGIVSAFVLIGSASGLTPSSPGTIEVFPSEGAFTSGVDSNGNISVLVTWFRGADDTHWNLSGGGVHEFPDGFWQTLSRIILSLVSNEIAFDVQFSTEDVMVYNQDLSDTPSNPNNNPPDWNGDIGTVELEIDYDNADNEDPDSIAIVRNGEVIANIPWVDGTTHYSFIDTVFAADTYEYEFFVYRYSTTSRSVISSPISIPIGGAPTITMTMSGGITFGGSATVVFLGNPTGTYTIIKGKRNDTLYNTDDDVKIPNPFVVTAFLPQ